MQTLTQIRALLASRGVRPRRSLGQNFLHDHNLIRRLVDAAGVGPGDLVLEVGPGTGALTVELLDRGCRVVACELDRVLADLVRDTLGESHGDRLTVIEGDCLDGKHRVNPAVLGAMEDGPFRLVANLPYGAATPLLLALLTGVPACSGMFVTIQHEVAERLLAGAGDDAYGSVSIAASVLADSERLATLPPACFWPRPEVTSAMIAMRRRDPAPPVDGVALALLCRDLFTMRRKHVRGAVLKRFGVEVADLGLDIDPQTRVEALPPEAFVALLAKLAPLA